MDEEDIATQKRQLADAWIGRFVTPVALVTFLALMIWIALHYHGISG
jgi:branched-subunit amino acid permease